MFKKQINEFKNAIFELNDYMADNPELGSNEFNSSKKMVDLLIENNINVEYPFNNMPTAFKGSINSNQFEKKFLIIAEYDALRGMGHACGHCASGSISLLAALILNDIKDSLNFQVDIIGTPDEEILGGKVFMADNGVFDEYDLAIMIHMDGKTSPFIPFLALDAFTIKFKGKASHAAASPWDGRNALNAMRLTFDAIDMMRQHIKDDVKIHGYIVNGGNASNIVPDYAEAEFLLRSESREYLNFIKSWFKDIVKGSALSTKTNYEIEVLGNPFHDLSSKPTGEEILKDLFIKHGYEISESTLPGGSSDIGNVDYIIPAFHPMISIGKPYSTHTIEFASEMKSENVHKAILDGASIISEFLIFLSNNDDNLSKIKLEHKKNRTY